MFKKKFRLNTSDFKEVFNFGETKRTPHYLIKKRENNLGYSRFSVVVSKKISKKAVERNHLKRRMFHALQEKASSLPKSDYIFILNSSVKDIQYSDLVNNLDTI